MSRIPERKEPLSRIPGLRFCPGELDTFEGDSDGTRGRAGAEHEMNDVWLVVGLALLPGLGNLAGGMAAEVARTTPMRLNLALHAASGVVIGVVAIELMPQALANLAGWWIAASFAAGGAAYIGAETAIERMTPSDSGGGSSSMWMIYVAVAVDLSGDGLMIGSGSAVAASLAAVLAAGQVMADFPEGYSVVANLRERGVSRRRRIAVSLSFPLYCLGIALIAWFLLREAPDAAKYVALSFVAGLLTVAAVEDMLEEAHEAAQDTRTSTLAFVGGFVLFALVSAGLETALGADGGSDGEDRPAGPRQSMMTSVSHLAVPT